MLLWVDTDVLAFDQSAMTAVTTDLELFVHELFRCKDLRCRHFLRSSTGTEFLLDVLEDTRRFGLLALLHAFVPGHQDDAFGFQDGDGRDQAKELFGDPLGIREGLARLDVIQAISRGLAGA